MIIVFETPDLVIRRAAPDKEDVALLARLWNDPRVMTNVGYPLGLQMSHEKILAQLTQQADSDFDSVLIVTEKATGEAIGQCELGSPNSEGMAHTDIKLIPEKWGRGYGTQTKLGLLNYLFTRTSCRAVEGTPNLKNVASQRMQRKVGGVWIEDRVHHFPESMKDRTVDVHYSLYVVTRESWEKRA